ncbi:MAG: penicillin-binding protein 1C [Chrysiogenetes bacterium]|nr:penicillin-binding protein 1C [Chrysiogenetes bacterium]
MVRSPLGAVALFVLGLCAGVVAAACLVPLPERLLAGPSRVVYFRDGTPAYVTLSTDDKWRIPVSVDEVDPNYLAALVEIEDGRFWWHPGVDPLAVVRALFQNVSAGGVVSGASTLTMQLVRVLEPRPRTLSSKFIEALRALQLELRLSKREILHAYLSFIPYGRNIEGLEAASLAYFGHRADALSPSEIATLLAVPQNPNSRYPTKPHVARLTAARDAILRRMGERGWPWPAVSVESTLTKAAPHSLKPFPREAPHAARWLLENNPLEARIRTTLDKTTQQFADGVLTRARASLAADGIFNGAVVIADHRSARIEALIGNFEFLENDHGAQIVGFDVPRSPGSLLKPFIYASAIDQGIVLPQTLVEDIPVHYGSYSPENYDQEFRGLVRMEEALSWSLNVPFVNLLGRVGVERFLGRLQSMGVRSLRSEPGYYGLSAAIGGVEITPLEIAGLFASLANHGRYRHLELLQPANSSGSTTETAPEGFSAFSEGATYLTRQTLSLRDRPDFPGRRDYSAMPPSIHWKTGTSFGHRDAWASGSGPRYTAVVWLGNFDNSPSNRLVGADAAGPILFDLLEGLASAEDASHRDLPPADLRPVRLCAYSGYVPTDACPHAMEALARGESVPSKPCPFHTRREIDLETGHALGPLCMEGRRHAPQTFLRWPANVRRWLKDRYRTLPEPPSFAPECRRPASEGRPAIISPPPGHVVFLIGGRLATEQEIPLEAEGASGAPLSWFVDGKYLGKALPDERLWWIPEPGKHLLLTQNELGESDSRWIEVRADRAGSR